MVHLIKSLLIFLLFANLCHASINKGSPLEREAKKISKDDLKAARNLEDFYWSFRRGSSKGIRFNIQRFKARKSKELRSFKPLLLLGSEIHSQMKTKKIISCPHLNRKNNIWKRYTALYRSRCIKHNLDLSLRQKHLKREHKEFIKQHFSLFTSYKNQRRLSQKLKSWSTQDQRFIGELIKDSLYKRKVLPGPDLLPYLSLDPKVTQFIQRHRLFDQKGKEFITQEFGRLVEAFKKSYLKGDEEIAKDFLENAVYFYEKNSSYINNSKAWRLFVISGKKAARRDDFPLAVELFKLSEKAADKDQIYESKFQSLFTYYRDRELHKARAFINEEKLVPQFDIINSKLRFWVARIYEESKEFKKAKELYLKQITKKPLSFYSILSLKKLRKLNPHYEVSLMVDKEQPNIDIPLGEELIRKATLFNLFNQARAQTLRSFQASDLRSLSPNKFFKGVNIEKAMKLKPYFLIKFFSDGGDHLHSFKVAYTNLNNGRITLNPFVIENLFPQKYRGDINKVAPRIQDRVILSLIRQESAFNEKAKSIAGARGLMQIMPATGRQFVRNLRTKALYSPLVNLKIGTRFLENLLTKYEGNLVFALAAYNAGPGNLGKWQRSIPFTNDMLTNVELIPFEETRNYVKLIYRNLFFYSFLDGSIDRLDFPINNSFMIALSEEIKR